MSKVYFSNNTEKILSLLKKNISNFKGKIGIKMHFGEEGCVTFLNPEIIKKIYFFLKKNNPKAEINLVECNVLYRGSRTETKQHLQTAIKHGFNFASIDICDSLGEEKIQVNLKHFKKILVGNVEKYDLIIAITHVKGHMETGFGGALKDIGMGLGSRAGKLAMHAGISPIIGNDCTGCGTCIKKCPTNAIILNGKARIKKEKCIGCAYCIAICPQNAIEIPWGAQTSDNLQERIVEYCFGILKKKKCLFINVLQNITADCDCMGFKQKVALKDAGITLSEDIVAIDKASYDLVNKAAGKNLFKEFHPSINAQHQFDYAEKLQLGTKNYELINLD